MKTYLYADAFFYPSGKKGPGYLELIDGKFGAFSTTIDPLNAQYVLDYSGYSIAPGLVDTHIHGYKNHDVMDDDLDGLVIMSEALLECGVTSFLPTTLTSSEEHLTRVAKTVAEAKEVVTGAKIAGIYFEGPFFDEVHKGAQNPAYFHDPSLETFEKWQTAANGLIKKIALAPEKKGVETFVQTLTDQGVVVALGHSDATFEQAKAAVDAGASVFVHAFNGMRGLNHREPGMVGALLQLDHVFSELICDGHHVHKEACGLLIDKVGPEHVALITDCMMAGGMPEGAYELGEFPVIVKEGTVRLESGNLAGSILKLKEAIQHVVQWGIATPEEAIMMASYVPAVSCKIEDTCGSIKSGRPADFIVLDKELELVATYLDGVKRYEKN